MVEAILEASTRVLSKTPLKDMTTNRVADLAGVSIGSLYEYFPNKNSIVVALMDSHMEMMLNDFFLTLKQNDFDSLVRAVLELIETKFLDKKIFMREIFIRAPESGRMEALYMGRFKAQKALEDYIVEKLGKERAWAARKSFILVNSVLGAVETYIFVDEVKISNEEFKKEMNTLIRAIIEI